MSDDEIIGLNQHQLNLKKILNYLLYFLFNLHFNYLSFQNLIG